MKLQDSHRKDAYRITDEKENTRFRIGIILMVSSFLVYLVFPLIPFLSYSVQFKVVLAFIVWAAAWIIFAVGFLLSGKKGYRKIKDSFRNFLRRDSKT
jgi:hypothetical protein